MRAQLLSLLLLAGAVPAGAQQIGGKVFGTEQGQREILPGAVLRWAGTTDAEMTNTNGVFSLDTTGRTGQQLIVSFTGFVSDTIDVAGKGYLTIVLKKEPTTLQGVTVNQNRSGFISSSAIGQTNVITRLELTKGACCDLAGCFGAQAAVQAQTTNVVTNAQELRMLGLSGVYNQLLLDGLPMFTGAAYTYGISAWPGVLIDNITVSKGTTSVLQGPEGITGQINMLTALPEETPTLLLNGYVNSFGETQYNAIGATPVGKGKKWRSLLSLHSVQPAARVDKNDDGFLDLPLLRRYAVFNKWTYRQQETGGLQMQAAVGFIQEQRTGGQVGYIPGTDAGSSTVYGQRTFYRQPLGYIKTSYKLASKHSLNLRLSGLGHDQESWFGTTRYKATQLSLNAALQHDWQWRQNQDFKWGVSYMLQNLDEDISFSANPTGKTYAGKYATPLRVPGVFAENRSTWADDKLMVLVGARLDHHQDAGLLFTPRLFLKWDVATGHTLRASAGRGWRQLNLFSEQVLLLATSRNLVFEEKLEPEQATTAGLSYVYRLPVTRGTGYFSADVYSTTFQNQFFPDYDRDPTRIHIYNFKGRSHALGAQAEASYTFFKRLDVRAAYNYLDVRQRINGEDIQLPFAPRHRAMAAVSYQTKNKRWQLDGNVHWTGKMRLPDTHLLPEAYQRDSYSEPYTMLAVQLRHRWKHLDIYAGVENLTGFRQENPIISAENPFGPYFDLSSVWGPTRGREFYLGMTLHLE